MWLGVQLIAALVLAGLITGSVAHASDLADGVVGDGTPASCTEAAFDAALVGGGTITFNCGGPATIVFHNVKSISGTVIIDGNNQITLSGNYDTRLFVVNADAHLTLVRILIVNGFVVGDGGAIINSGKLVVTDATLRNNFTDLTHSGGAIVSYGPLTITHSVS